MRRAVRVALAATAVAVAVVLLIWRWRVNHTTLLAVAAGLLVLGGIPAIVWLVDQAPPESSRRLPRYFWVGLGLALIGLVSVTLFAAPSGMAVTSIGTGASSSSSENLVRVRRVPTSLNTAVAAALPGTHAVWAFANTAEPGITNWEVLIGTPHRLLAEANWNGRGLTFTNMSWNAYFAGQTAAPQYTIAALRRRIQLPSHARVWGPYRLPGYDVLVVPHPAQVWDINLETGAISGGNG